MNQSAIQCKLCQGTMQLWYPQLFDDRYGYPGYFDVYRCAACDFAQITPEPAEEDLVTLYTDYYPRKEMTAQQVRQQAFFSGTWQQRLKNYYTGVNNACQRHVSPNTDVLDIGCGSGASLLEIQQQGARAYGTELDQNVQQIADELGLNIHFADLDTSPYPDAMFDTVTMSQLIEHIKAPIDFLQLAARKVKAGGSIIMSTPNVQSYNRKSYRSRWINWHIPYHMNFFSHSSLRILAEKAGLTVERIITITPEMWTGLQILAKRDVATMGQASPVWISKLDTSREMTIKKMLAYGIAKFTVPYYRIIDKLGWGDSFLVFLRKPHLDSDTIS